MCMIQRFVVQCYPNLVAVLIVTTLNRGYNVYFLLLIATFCSQPLPLGWAVAKQLVFKKVHKALGFQECRISVVGGEPTRREVHDYFMSINIPLMEVYGLSECSGCHTVNLRHNHFQQDGWRVGSCGKPIRGVELKIFDQDANGAGEVSEKSYYVPVMGMIRVSIRSWVVFIKPFIDEDSVGFINNVSSTVGDFALHLGLFFQGDVVQ